MFNKYIVNKRLTTQTQLQKILNLKFSANTMFHLSSKNTLQQKLKTDRLVNHRKMFANQKITQHGKRMKFRIRS